MRNLMVLLIALAAVFSLPASGQNEDASSEAPIRIGIMPDAGALPLLLMEGVELIPFMSARERDMAVQAGELDGIMTDMVAVVSFGQNGMPQKVLTITESRFMLVAGPAYREGDKWQVGLSENTVIEFMVDQLAAGREVEKISVPQVPVRMEMLRGGQLPLACLTDAMAWPLLSHDYPIVADQSGTGLEPAVLSFTQDFVDANPEKVAAFAEGWNEAVETINADPEAYRSLLLEQIRLPDDPDHPYPVPELRPVMLPPRTTVDAVLAWYDDKYGLNHPVSFEDLVIP